MVNKHYFGGINRFLKEEIDMSQEVVEEVVKSPMITEHWVEVSVFVTNSKSGQCSRSYIYPGEHYDSVKRNLHIELFVDDGQLVCEVDFWNANKRRKPKIWLLTTDTERVETFMPFQMRENGRFEIKRRTYLILFKSATRRLGASSIWADVKSDCAAYLGILLYHPSGAPIERNQGGRTLRAGLDKQPGVDVVPGMVVDDFKPEARIISIDGDRAVVSFDPADWPKEEE